MAIEIGYWTKNILLFSLHVGIWTLWTLLIRASQPDNSGYPYDVVTVVFLTEFTKFTLSALFHFYPIPITQWGREASNILGQFSMGVYFAVPAFVYTMYNSLFFLNLVFFDPVSYRVLINIRIVWSGLLYQFFFNQRLGLKKWSALGLLTLGCAVNQMSPEFKLVTSPLYLAAIGFQAFTSSFGGAYSEVLLKKDFDISLNVKNMYLYAFSMFFNGLFIVAYKSHLLSYEQWFTGYTPITFCIILIGALCGFSTALFLKYLNVILKEYAHSGEVFLTAILSAMFFGVEIGPKMILSMLLVTVSVLIYNHKPAPAPHLPSTSPPPPAVTASLPVKEQPQGNGTA